MTGVWLIVIAGLPPFGASPTSPSWRPLEVRADRFVATATAVEARGRVSVRAPAFRLEAARLILRTASVAPSIEAVDAWITPCRCPPGHAPSWSMRADRLTLDARGVALRWPVLCVKDVPMLALPWGYWPLGDRHSGLMVPAVRAHPRHGIEVGQPVYVVLGPSADLTVTPAVRTRRGVSGTLEARNHPAPGVRGVVAGQVQYDAAVRDGLDWRWGPSGRARYRLEGWQAVGPVDLALDLLGDAGGNELDPAFAERQAEVARSVLTYSTRAGGVRWTVGAQWLQDLRPRTYPGRARPRVRLFTDPEATAIRQRVLSLGADVAPTPLGRGAPGREGWGAARLRADALAAPDPDTPRFVRADARPVVGVDAVLPGGLTLATEAGLRATAWAGEGPEAGRLAPRLAATLAEPLGRSYGPWFHLLRPEVGALWIPTVAGVAVSPYPTEDEIDVLAAAAQVRLGLSSDLSRYDDHLTLDLWSGRDFRPPGEARAGAGWGPLVVQAGARSGVGRGRSGVDAEAIIDWVDGPVALRAGVDWSRRGLALGARAAVVRAEVPAVWFIAPEEILPSPTLGSQRDAYGRGAAVPWRPQTAVGAWARFRPWTPLAVRAALTLSFAEDRAAIAEAYPEGRFRSVVRTAELGATYTSPCRCWSVRADAALGRDLAGLPVGVGLGFGAGTLRP